MFTFLDSLDNTLPKYHFTSSVPAFHSPEHLKKLKDSIKAEFPNGPLISKTVKPDIDLSVQDRMKHIGKEIIKLRKRKR